MNKCIDNEISEMLPDLLHGALGAEAMQRTEAHLATCEECRAELNVLRAVKSAAVFAPAIDAEWPRPKGSVAQPRERGDAEAAGAQHLENKGKSSAHDGASDQKSCLDHAADLVSK